MEHREAQKVWLLHWSPDHYHTASVQPGTNNLQFQQSITFNGVHEGLQHLSDFWIEGAAANATIHVSITDAHAVQLPYVWRKGVEAAYRETAPLTEHLLQAPIPAWQVIQAYAAPIALHEWLHKNFAAVEYHSASALALATYNGFSETVQLIVLLGVRSFTVLLKGSGGLQLCQTYYYTAPLDVVYYLLKIKEQFRLADGVQLVLAGEAVMDKRLLEQISTYFPQSQLAVPPHRETAGFEGTAPQLFHLLNLAACVS